LSWSQSWPFLDAIMLVMELGMIGLPLIRVAMAHQAWVTCVAGHPASMALNHIPLNGLWAAPVARICPSGPTAVILNT
jgi:hypothetical protein